MPAIMSCKETKDSPSDWENTLIGSLIGFVAVLLIIGAAFLWRWLDRDTKATVKAQKKLEKSTNKKWWTWPLFHQCPESETITITNTLDANGNQVGSSSEILSRQISRPRRPVYAEWPDSTAAPSEHRNKASHWDADEAGIPLRYIAPPAGLHIPAPPKAKLPTNFLNAAPGSTS
ncbi:hypothetical protein N7516_004726 [Penicillium verrucosum]|uniref:uncharacterized protein n=1 Tax=Penicillium verrucosum TaxID=60171 RepID=UPI0025451AA1|nr:uncharacterized protein N7516_004726 [Penicillium verrucosum]KAJ5944558.1 hypothetical protein N7516_004726 [Penicillium verrucosum]